MENFCWEWEVLHPLTAHVDSGEPLPRALFDRMLAATQLPDAACRRCASSSSRCSTCACTATRRRRRATRVLACSTRCAREVAVSLPPAYNRFPHAFSHIFAGGYAAGYYSYKWAEVLSADAYAAFEEAGVLNPATGQRFRDEILAVGGSRPAMESFMAFRGREPTIDALLRHHGMT